MAICKYCEQEMNTADGCRKMPVKTLDGPLDPVLYGDERATLSDPPKYGHRCHDCGVQPGFYHHPGCDWEECPRCHEQLIGCECDPEAIPSSTTPEIEEDQKIN